MCWKGMEVVAARKARLVDEPDIRLAIMFGSRSNTSILSRAPTRNTSPTWFRSTDS